ncbi:MAG TPA: TetR/AcrR family transcriptional regulator [Sporichthya sp.]|nr:TetR/AcrR family transcriptional regulator [Sporichthya sp.]
MAGGNPTRTPDPAAPARRRPGRPTGSTAGRSVRREEYLDGIIEAIRRIGPEATLAELAAGAGMSKPVLYDHFTDRLGLTAAVVGKLTVTVAADAMLAALSGGEPEELLAKVFDVFVAFVESEPQIYGWVIRAAGDLPAGGLSELPMATEAGTHLSKMIGTVLRSAGVDSGGAEPWAFGVLGFVVSATGWWLNRRSMSRQDFVDYLAKFVWGGLSSAGVVKIDILSVLAAVPAMVDAGRAVMESIERPAVGGEGRDA